MNLADRERVEVQLIGFCIRVIENEARNIHREINLRRRKEKTFSDLTESEMNQLSRLSQILCKVYTRPPR